MDVASEVEDMATEALVDDEESLNALIMHTELPAVFN